jgi:hypothetical protein
MEIEPTTQKKTVVPEIFVSQDALSLWIADTWYWYLLVYVNNF